MQRRSFFGVIEAAVAAMCGVKSQGYSATMHPTRLLTDSHPIPLATFDFGGKCTYVQARRVAWRGKLAWWVSFVIEEKPNVELLLAHVPFALLTDTCGKERVQYPAMWHLGWLSREDAYALDYQGEWADSQRCGYLQHGAPTLTASEARWLTERSRANA